MKKLILLVLALSAATASFAATEAEDAAARKEAPEQVAQAFPVTNDGAQAQGEAPKMLDSAYCGCEAVDCCPVGDPRLVW